MFRRSRRKIVASIMGILGVLFVGTLGVIYFSSYIEVFQKDWEMLSLYAEAYWVHGNPAEEEKTFHLQTFYSVEFSDEGQVLDINNRKLTGMDDEELVELAAKLGEKRKKDGIYRDWHITWKKIRERLWWYSWIIPF